MLEYLLPQLQELPDWSPESLEAFIKSICQERGLKMGKVAQPIRVAVSGTTISPSIHETLVMLGRGRTIARMRRCLDNRE